MELQESHEVSFGRYDLDSSIDGLIGLVEFSPLEYKAIQSGLPNERIFKAPTVEFLGVTWKVDLGCVGDQIYKIAPHWESDDSAEAAAVLSRVYEYCLKHWGVHAESKGHLKLWQTDWGNVIVQTYQFGNRFGISLFLTSKSIAQQTRTRPYRFGKWYGYLQIAMGIGGLAALLFTRNFVYALGVPLIVIGYGLVEKKKWAFLSLLAALGLSTLGLISQINKAKNDADEWSTSVTPDLKNTLGWYEKEWAGIQSDPQWSNSAEEQRNEMANFYRRQRVEQDSIIAAALKTNPDLELVLNRRFSHQMAVPNGSSDNVSECLAQTDLDAIHGCMTQRLRDAITRAVLALSFSGMVVAYYWKRKDEMA